MVLGAINLRTMINVQYWIQKNDLYFTPHFDIQLWVKFENHLLGSDMEDVATNINHCSYSSKGAIKGPHNHPEATRYFSEWAAYTPVKDDLIK